MIDIQTYLSSLTALLRQHFGHRLLYVGLQGSYLRNEATEDSDIDIMVIIDSLGAKDLAAYRTAIASLDHFDKSCGFICGKEDMAAWNPLEICHLLHSTKDFYGTLSDFVPGYTDQDVQNFIKLSLNNLYHEICHLYIHGSLDANRSRLPRTYRGVFFILQNLHYLASGRFICTKAELLQALDGKHLAVLERSLALAKGAEYDFEENFELLLTWCQETLQALT